MNFAKSIHAALLVVAGLAGCRVESRPPQPDGTPPGTPPPPPPPPGAPSSDGGDTSKPGEERSCGGIAGLRCPAGTYCAYGPFQRCGMGDAMAKCKPRPEVCTEEYKPVCGCDGKDYGNACAAARAGTSYSKEGTCK